MTRSSTEYIKSSNLEHKRVFHGFFTRKGGSSTGLFSGLNCGVGSGDNKENIRNNRLAVAKEVGVRGENLLGIYQEHGSNVVDVKDAWPEEKRPRADALVCDKSGIAISILSADCAPVLFVGEKENLNPVIGAAHAGWKGALGGVIEKTLEAMENLGASKNTISACVGPCIAQASYEVGGDFVSRFTNDDPLAEQFFYSKQGGSGEYFDLSGYCGWKLTQYGVKNVSVTGVDTYSNKEMFYSFRRSVHSKESQYGRQISVISIL